MLIAHAALFLLAASPVTDETVATDAQAWHDRRIERLRAEDGWLSLVGLRWLEEGQSTIGSAKDAKVKLPLSAPAKVGTLVRKGKEVSLSLEPGVELKRGGEAFTGGPVKSDAEGAPDVLTLGSIRFQIIARGERLGVRIKDANAEARTHFKGLERFPAKAAWRVEAKLIPNKTPKTIPVPTVLGTVEKMPSPGTLVFKLGGKEHRLDPVLEEGSEELFIIFGDKTNRDSTYGAGRFLYAKVEGDKAVLDFNKSYNPPCAFSPYATCPLPPKQNKLPVRVEAGEMRYAGRH